MAPWFIATEKFTRRNGESWSSYINWSGLYQLRELVSLDAILCPSVLPEIRDEYWPHIVNEHYMLNFFHNFDFFSREIANVTRDKNVLCVFRNPPDPPKAPPVADFEFLGYDLVDVDGDVSALSNCGGFPDVFANSELSEVGLLPNFQRAVEVQARLRSLHPEEPHADCHLWAIFRVAS
jgi:hypothetical protein